jgi:hypothetical protein
VNHGIGADDVAIGEPALADDVDGRREGPASAVCDVRVCSCTAGRRLSEKAGANDGDGYSEAENPMREALEHGVSPVAELPERLA